MYMYVFFERYASFIKYTGALSFASFLAKENKERLCTEEEWVVSIFTLDVCVKI